MIIIQLHVDALYFQGIVKNLLVENLVIYVVNIESFWFCLESKTFRKPQKSSNMPVDLVAVVLKFHW